MEKKVTNIKMAIFAGLSLLLTLGYHNLLPNHKVEFSHSYLLHFLADSTFNFILLVVTWEANLSVNRRLDKHFKWQLKPVKRLALQIILNTIHSFLLLFILVTLYGLILSEFLPHDVQKEQVTGAYPVLKNALVTFVTIFLLYQAAYIGVYFFRQWISSLTESEKLKRENVSAQLQALQAQVNPHFLFNSLSSLVSLIEEDKTLAVKFVEELSGVYRYLLQQKNETLVRLCDEMEFIHSFIYLHKARCGDNLKTVINIDRKFLNYFIPPQTVQILVENAIKHNVISNSKPLTIKFYSDNEGFLTVENNLQKKLSASAALGHEGTGLKNIRDRYSLLHKRNILIEETESVFRVRVPMISPEDTGENSNS